MDLLNEVMTKWPATIEQRDDSGLLYTLPRIWETSLRGFMVMFELLKACPDMCELLDNKGRNALHAAVESGGWIAIGFFRKRPKFEGLINEKDEEGNTPMHLAAINGDILTASQLAEVRGVVLNATNKEGYTPLDNVLLREKLNSWKKKELWEKGARQSLRGALIKMGIRNLKPRSKPKLAGDGDANGEGKSESDCWKRVSETNMLVATLIATHEDVAFHKKVARRTAFLTNWPIGALLVAFIAGIYSVVPHTSGITVAVLHCCCSVNKEEGRID
uniref:PGG domain-containing protein n=1 Tax=Quercus lobata TaxID=97700 RepID=A0A7N2L5W2_QUELO